MHVCMYVCMCGGSLREAAWGSILHRSTISTPRRGSGRPRPNLGRKASGHRVQGPGVVVIYGISRLARVIIKYILGTGRRS